MIDRDKFEAARWIRLENVIQYLIWLSFYPLPPPLDRVEKETNWARTKFDNDNDNDNDDRIAENVHSTNEIKLVSRLPMKNRMTET